LSILQVLLSTVPSSIVPEELLSVSTSTHGYVGADLSSLVKVSPSDFCFFFLQFKLKGFHCVCMRECFSGHVCVYADVLGRSIFKFIFIYIYICVYVYVLGGGSFLVRWKNTVLTTSIRNQKGKITSSPVLLFLQSQSVFILSFSVCLVFSNFFIKRMKKLTRLNSERPMPQRR
jgi:hypothetical protein